MTLERCAAVASGSTAGLGHTTDKTATVVTLPAVRAAALRLRVVDDRACNGTVMAGQGPYSLPKVVKSKATKTLMLWAGTAVAS